MIDFSNCQHGHRKGVPTVAGWVDVCSVCGNVAGRYTVYEIVELLRKAPIDRNDEVAQWLNENLK